jgi:thiosulfate dehydrogenase
MGKFIAGVIIGILGVAAGAYIYVHYGFLNMQADQPIAGIERFYLRGAMDRYAERFAPVVKNPLQPTDETLIQGIRLYKSNCAVCHGGPLIPISEVGRGLYPRAPQFLQDSPDMPEHENYWIIKHGVARTGMPAWDKVLSDADIWKLTTFLGKMEVLEKLSPAVQEAWKSSGEQELGVQPKTSLPAPAMPKSGQHEGHHHHD